MIYRFCLKLASLLAFAAMADAASAPNIVLILADDMGIGDPACYNGESKISILHIDRVAEECTRFTDAHSQSPG